MNVENLKVIKALIGLGNPGKQYEFTRHNVGFLIVDQLVDQLGGQWHEKENMLLAQVNYNEQSLLIIKPQTYMNSSGKVLPFLLKKGIKAENIMVVHDELELPFSKYKVRFGSSAKGHNGLKSIIELIGKDFYRFAFGIDRPAQKEEVPNYVLAPFTEGNKQVETAIKEAAENLMKILAT